MWSFPYALVGSFGGTEIGTQCPVSAPPTLDLGDARRISCILVHEPLSDNVTLQSGAMLSWLEQREDEIAAQLADPVSIPTENPPAKHYRPCVNPMH